MRAIIIGAGRGQRLMPTTADHPKCFAMVKSKRILDWTLEAFASHNIDDVCFIGGYQIEKVQEAYPRFTFRHNRDWPNNNILGSLMHAEDLMHEPFICCYSDTLFSPTVVGTLLKSEKDITLAVDTDWKARYEHRTEHPMDDAEKVTVHNGTVTRIHRGLDPGNAYAEYTGVAMFNTQGGACLKKEYARCQKLHSGKPFREAKIFEKAYLIHLLQEMLEQGVVMHHVDTPGQYMEIDTQQDFDLAQTQWQF
jgi:choline kinase